MIYRTPTDSLECYLAVALVVRSLIAGIGRFPPPRVLVDVQDEFLALRSCNSFAGAIAPFILSVAKRRRAK